MSHDIEFAADNVKKTHGLIVQANEKIRELDFQVQRNLKTFLNKLRSTVSDNRKKGLPPRTGLDQVYKAHDEAVKLQEQKVKICKETYNAIDTEVNQFDDRLQKYIENKEEARNGEAAVIRRMILQKRKKKKSNRRRQRFIRGESKVREVESKEEAADFNVDSSEPRYCFCQRVAFGRMVACDGENCKYEWFHFVCVGLTEDPEDDWYCQECQARRKMKDKRSKDTMRSRKSGSEPTLSPLKKKPVNRRRINPNENPEISENQIQQSSKKNQSPSKTSKSLVKEEKTPKKAEKRVGSTPSKTSTPAKIKQEATTENWTQSRLLQVQQNARRPTNLLVEK
ncbi:hypothetical protein FO519_002317 [Halicephalobus sp. NKZ332]|nr:hypothetical protein FO519_002317 [Halicephalobus sp. NKZ332]